MLAKSKVNKCDWQQMAVVRLPNAPSIPSHNNVFGYEETPNGELIQQQNPEKIFAGTASDTVGPGHYEIKREIVRKSGTNWHASKVKRLGFLDSKNDTAAVGPGSYDPLKPVASPQQKVRGTSVFVSTVPKALGGEKLTPPRINSQGDTADDDNDDEEDDNEEAVPGPGHYNPKAGAFENKFAPSGIQQFGHTAPRFMQPRATLGNTLGPGQYGDFRQSMVFSIISNMSEIETGKKESKCRIFDKGGT